MPGRAAPGSLEGTRGGEFADTEIERVDRVDTEIERVKDDGDDDSDSFCRDMLVTNMFSRKNKHRQIFAKIFVASRDKPWISTSSPTPGVRGARQSQRQRFSGTQRHGLRPIFNIENQVETKLGAFTTFPSGKVIVLRAPRPLRKSPILILYSGLE